MIEAAVKLRPAWAEAHQALGEVLRATGNLQCARSEFELAIKLKPDFAQARIDLGLELLNAGEPALAAPHLDRAIALFASDAEAAYPLYLRAKIHTTNGDAASAATLLDKAVKLRPDFAEAWSDLGVARKALQEFPAALAAFERSVQADPENAIAQSRLGAEYLRQGNASAALTHLRKSYALNPKDQSMLNSLLLALRQTGNTAEAGRIRAELADVLKEIDRESQRAFRALNLNNEGAALEKQGRLSEACDKYREALTLDPSHNGVRVNFAIAALRLGKWDEGLAALREAARREPANAKIQQALADALRQAPTSKP